MQACVASRSNVTLTAPEGSFSDAGLLVAFPFSDLAWADFTVRVNIVMPAHLVAQCWFDSGTRD